MSDRKEDGKFASVRGFLASDTVLLPSGRVWGLFCLLFCFVFDILFLFFCFWKVVRVLESN